MDNLITEDWLRKVGFKWHEFERQPHKHWLLWLGGALRGYSGVEDLGIEVTAGAMDGKWFCWLRSDVARRYSRFIHARHLTTQEELVSLIEALTGQTWDPENNFYGMMLTPEHAARERREAERLDRRWLRNDPKRHDIEKDDTRGGALPEHMQAAIDAGKVG